MKSKLKNLIAIEDEVNIVWAVAMTDELFLLKMDTEPVDEEALIKKYEDDEYLTEYSPLEIRTIDANPTPERFPGQMVHGSLSVLLKYRGHSITENEKGTLITFNLDEDTFGTEVKLSYQLYAGTHTVECFNVIENKGCVNVGLQEVSSFSLNGIEKDSDTPYAEQFAIHILHNGWQKELAWRRYTPEELGLSLSQPGRRVNSSKIIECSNVGTWSAKKFIPAVYIERLFTGETMALQILNNGGWQWQMGEHDGHVYLKAAGPSETIGDWYKELKPGEMFESVHASVTIVKGTAEEAAREVNKYRRAIRRPNWDDEKLPVIFNDYMNCLWGDPTTEKELPMIDMAAECGCEVYCIDCGWYDDGPWWDGVGEWMPAQGRFPGGLQKLLDKIKEKGMIPGLWLELEVVGINSPLIKRVPREWFFMRHGRAVQEKSRYQLDFRNPEVRAFADSVIKRLVEDYGVGYIKMDYNIDPGTGTSLNASSAGEGLLDHNRAYLNWLSSVFERYPKLIIENCSSGGMRMDYAMLSRYSIQSTSDMEDYRTYSTITVNAPLALTPEQAAVWSYPLMDGTPEETVVNMINTIPLRIHQSGHLVKLSPERRDLVKEAISYYKKIRGDRNSAIPFWPLGFSDYSTPWVSLGLTGREKTYLAVWRRNSDDTGCDLSLPQFKGKNVPVLLAYPSTATEPDPSSFTWNSESGILHVELPEKFTARFYEIG